MQTASEGNNRTQDQRQSGIRTDIPQTPSGYKLSSVLFSWQGLTVVLLLIGLFVALRWTFFTGLFFTDDLSLYHTAVQVYNNHNPFSILAKCRGRFGLPLVLSLVMMITGPGLHAVLITGLLLGAVTLGLSYWLARQILPTWGLVVAVLMCMVLSPVDITYTVTAFPDTLSNLVALTAVVLLFMTMKVDSLRRQLGLFFFSGLIAGFSLMGKESAVLLLILLIPAVSFCCFTDSLKRKLAKCVMGAVGFIMYVLLEMAVFWVVLGNPLQRFMSRIQANSATDVSYRFKYAGLGEKLQTWFTLWVREDTFDMLLIATAVISAVCLLPQCLKPQSRVLRFVLVWFLAALAVLLISAVFTYSYQPRRLLPLLLPATLLGLHGWLWLTVQPWFKGVTRGAVTALLSALLLFSVLSGLNVLVNGRFPGKAWLTEAVPAYCYQKVRPLYGFSAFWKTQAPSYPNARIYTDTATDSGLRALWLPSLLDIHNFVGPYQRQFDQDLAQSQRHQGPPLILLLNDEKLRHAAQSYALPNLFYAPPMQWKKIYSARNSKLEVQLTAYEVVFTPVPVQETSLAIPNGGFYQHQDHVPTLWSFSEPQRIQVIRHSGSTALRMQLPRRSKDFKVVSGPIPVPVRSSHSSGRYLMTLGFTSDARQMMNILLQEEDAEGHQTKTILRSQRGTPKAQALETTFTLLPSTRTIRVGVGIRGEGTATLHPFTLRYQVIQS
jgi:hypothetical protein